MTGAEPRREQGQAQRAETGRATGVDAGFAGWDARRWDGHEQARTQTGEVGPGEDRQVEEVTPWHGQ